MTHIAKTCGTCKFKGKPLDDDPRYFRCERVKHDMDRKFRRGQKAVVVDGSGYHAALCVEDEFGCVEWKATQDSE